MLTLLTEKLFSWLLWCNTELLYIRIFFALAIFLEQIIFWWCFFSHIKTKAKKILEFQKWFARFESGDFDVQGKIANFETPKKFEDKELEAR